MNIVIFAGGIGTRLWPLSRKKSPKQFERVVGDKSTLQLAVNRISSSFNPQNIYISTNKQYVDLIHQQLPQISKQHIIGEPVMRDVGPAVGLVTALLAKQHPHAPMAIIWSDHLVKNEQLFGKILKAAEGIVAREQDKIVFIAQKPRFASENLGWIKFGHHVKTVDEILFYQFQGLKYRPDTKTANEFFSNPGYAWNLGYFVTTPAFLWEKYKEYTPVLYEKLKRIQDALGTEKYESVLSEVYPTLEKISFDNAILEKLVSTEAYVVSEDIEWSDIGAWEALKEALSDSPDSNVTSGKVETIDSKDMLAYNYNDSQLLVTIDVEGLLVINTADVTLVCKKESVPKIKAYVESLTGTDKEHLT